MDPRQLGIFQTVKGEVFVAATALLLFARMRRKWRRQREQDAANREEEAHLRLEQTALAAAANAIVITDREGRVTRVNPAFTQLTGYTPEEAIGQNLRFLKSGRHDEAFYRDLWDTILSGRVWHGEVINRRKDGSLYTAELTITPVRDRQGEIDSFIGISQDVSGRKIAEEALLKQTRQLEAVRAVSTEITRELHLPALLDLIIRRAVELAGAGSGQIFLWDEAAERLIPGAWCGMGDRAQGLRLRLGESVGGMVAERREGMIVNDYRSSPYAHRVVREHSAITAVLSEPLLYHDRLVGVISVDDQGTGRIFTEEDQSLIRLFAAQAAISIENARLYEEIRRQAVTLEHRVQERTRQVEAVIQELQTALRHKSEFLANMSHELRTPLNSIIGFAEVLEDQVAGPLTAKQARFLGHIHQSGRHLLDLINDILDLSKVEAGKLTLQPRSLSVASTLGAVLVLARDLATKKSQRLHSDIEPDLPPLQADPVRFKQICFNLLSNAIKFTPDGGAVRVAAHRVMRSTSQSVESSGPIDRGTDRPIDPDGDWLQIAVRDTGIGIKPEDLPRLFQEFVQLESIETKRHEGTGLGLALTKRLVELHGGRIWAESEGEGRGSTFTVLLPLTTPGG